MSSFYQFYDLNILYYYYALNYLVAYAISTFGLLLVFSCSKIKSNNMIKNIKLVTRDTFLYHALIIFVSNLVGIPPFSGFVAKTVLLASAATKLNPFSFVAFFSLILLSVIFYIQLLKLIKKVKFSTSDLRLNKQLDNFTKNQSEPLKYQRRFVIVWLIFFSVFYIFFYKDLALCFCLFLVLWLLLINVIELKIVFCIHAREGQF